MLEGREPRAKAIVKQKPFDIAMLKFRAIFVFPIAFNKKSVPSVTLVELGNACGRVFAILDKSIDLSIRAVQRCVMFQLPCNTDLHTEFSDVGSEIYFLFENRPIIHHLPNPHPNNLMACHVPKNLQILRPARDIDPIEQRPRSQRAPFLRHQPDVLEVAFEEQSKHGDFQFGGRYTALGGGGGGSMLGARPRMRREDLLGSLFSMGCRVWADM